MNIRKKFKSLLYDLKSRQFNGTVPVFHSVGSEDKSHEERSYIHDISIQSFEKQLVKLKKRCDIIPLDEMTERLRRGTSTRRLASITFDDGYKNFITNALPVLEHLNIPATLFLTTNLIEGSVFWRDKVRYIISQQLLPEFLTFLNQKNTTFIEISASEFYQQSKTPSYFRSIEIDGWMDEFFKLKNISTSKSFKQLFLKKTCLVQHPLIQFGNHTANHYVMSSLRKEEQFEEINSAQKYLETLGLPLSKAFAVPFGDPRSFNLETIRCARDLGFETVLLAMADQPRGFTSGQAYQTDENILVGMRFLPGKERLY